MCVQINVLQSTTLSLLRATTFKLTAAALPSVPKVTLLSLTANLMVCVTDLHQAAACELVSHVKVGRAHLFAK